MLEFHLYFVIYYYIYLIYSKEAHAYNKMNQEVENLLKCLKEEEYSRWRKTSEASDFLSKVLSKKYFYRNY